MDITTLGQVRHPWYNIKSCFFSRFCWKWKIFLESFKIIQTFHKLHTHTHTHSSSSVKLTHESYPMVCTSCLTPTGPVLGIRVQSVHQVGPGAKLGWYVVWTPVTVRVVKRKQLLNCCLWYCIWWRIYHTLLFETFLWLSSVSEWDSSASMWGNGSLHAEVKLEPRRLTDRRRVDEETEMIPLI